MKKKTKIILASIVVCIIVVALGAVIKISLDRQAKKKSLAEGETAIETYLQSFQEESEEAKKEEIYASFQSDEKINAVIEKYFQSKKERKEEWYKNYSKTNKEMYNYFVDYFNDLVDKENENFENDKSITNCDVIIGNLNNINDELKKDNALSSDDKNDIKDTLSGYINTINDEINNIVSNYNDTYNSYVISDVDNASKDDLNTAITNLNTLKDELTNLGTDHFTDIIANIDNDVEAYTNKVSEIEEEEKKAAEEAEKKKQEEKKKKEAAAANNNSNSNSSDNSSNNSSSPTPSRGGLTQDSWAITGNCWDDSEGQNVIYNAPQVIYDAYNAGKSYIWYAQDGKCAWGIEYDTICYICDRYGNVLYTN